MNNIFQPAKRLDSLQEYFFSRAAEKIAAVQKTGTQIINLGIGSPDLPPPPAVIEKLTAELANPANHVYPPYNGIPEFRQAIAQWYTQNYSLNFNADTQVLPLAGSKQGIIHLTLAVIDKGDQVLVPNPGYSAYAKAATMAGGEVVEYSLTEENGFLPDIKQLESFNLSRVKMIWINYPNNPTGADISREQLQELLEFTRQHNIIIASDNPYSHVTFDGHKTTSILEDATPNDLVIELNSLSKTYNMAGWRIGWAVGHPEIIAALKNINSNIETGMFIPLQKAAVIALQTPPAWIEQRNQVYAERRASIISLLEALNCTVFPPKASLYVWAKLPGEVTTKMTAEAYCFALLEKTGVFLTPGTAFGSNGEGYVRVAICQPKEVIEDAKKRVTQQR
jgi:LL-diaminopimelate aminotransferase